MERAGRSAKSADRSIEHTAAAIALEGPRFCVFGETQLSADVFDRLTGEFFMANTPEIAHAFTDWANAKWFAQPDDAVRRLRAMDEHERECADLPPRPDHEELRAYVAEIKEKGVGIFAPPAGEPVSITETAAALEVLANVANSEAGLADSDLNGPAGDALRDPLGEASPPSNTSVTTPNEMVAASLDRYAHLASLMEEALRLQLRANASDADLTLSQAKTMVGDLNDTLRSRLHQLYGDRSATIDGGDAIRARIPTLVRGIRKDFSRLSVDDQAALLRTYPQAAALLAAGKDVAKSIDPSAKGGQGGMSR